MQTLSQPNKIQTSTKTKANRLHFLWNTNVFHCRCHKSNAFD